MYSEGHGELGMLVIDPEQLRKVLAKQSVGQVQLAALSGVSRATLGKLVSGKSTRVHQRDTQTRHLLRFADRDVFDSDVVGLDGHRAPLSCICSDVPACPHPVSGSARNCESLIQMTLLVQVPLDSAVLH